MIKIEEHYCDSDDMTFITEAVYDGDESLISEEVVGFYYGRPDYTSTGMHYRQYKAEHIKEFIK